MFKRIILASALLMIPGITFLLWQFWSKYSYEIDFLTERETSKFANQVNADINTFNKSLKNSTALLNSLDLITAETNIGFASDTYDWESFHTRECQAKTSLRGFRDCFSYIRKSENDKRKLGAVYTWLRQIKNLSPNYYELVYNDQVAEMGIRMSPDIEGYHWLEFDQKQMLFFYRFSEISKQGFSLLVDPIKLWKSLNLSPIIAVAKKDNHGYQNHPFLSGMRFTFEPDLEALNRIVVNQQILFTSIIFLIFISILAITYAYQKVFLGELHTLGFAATEWTPGKELSIEIDSRFREVKALIGILQERSQLSIEQNKNFKIIRKLQALGRRDENLIDEFREVLQDSNWSPNSSESNLGLSRDFNKSIQKLIKYSSVRNFNNLVNEIYQLKQIFIEHEAKNKQIKKQKSYVDIAANTQQLLLRNTSQKKFHSLSWDVKCLPGRQVAGDFFILCHHRPYTYFCIADVAGKGLTAGLFGARLKAALDALTLKNLDISKIIEAVNEIAVENKPLDSFCTCFLGRFNHSTYALEYGTAGHNGMYLLRDNSIEELSSKGLPLGLVSGLQYVIQHRQLKAKDRLILYSDGCVELENSNQEIFTFARFKDLVLDNRFEPTDQILGKLMNNLQDFREGIQQADDMTLLVVDV